MRDCSVVIVSKALYIGKLVDEVVQLFEYHPHFIT